MVIQRVLQTLRKDKKLLNSISHFYIMNGLPCGIIGFGIGFHQGISEMDNQTRYTYGFMKGLTGFGIGMSLWFLSPILFPASIIHIMNSDKK